MQDGAISHTAHTTLNLLQAHRVKVLPWPSKSPDLNPVEHIWDDIDMMVRRRDPVNVRQYYSNLQFAMERNCTAHMSEVRVFDAQSLPGRHPSE